MNRYYPVMFDTRDFSCLVVGGGKVAERKVDSLSKTEASITVVSPEFTARLEEIAEDFPLELINRQYQAEDIRKMDLVFVATDNKNIQVQVRKDAASEKIPVNVVDRPEECDFIVPAQLRRGDLLVAISTSGQSPALAKKMRRCFEEKLPPEYSEYLAALGNIRGDVFEKIDSPRKRKEFFETVVYSDIFEKYCRGQIANPGKEIKEKLKLFLEKKV